MKTNMYVIYDRVAQEAGPIFEAKNDGVAYRSFAKLREGQETPEDFSLLKLGMFDHDIVKLTIADEPIDVVSDTIVETEVD